MRLDELINELPIALRQGTADLQLTGLTDDSRRVQPGHLFIARPGTAGLSARFIQDAVTAGAAALLLSAIDDDALSSLGINERVAVACVSPDTALDQRLCGKLAERFYGHPSRKLKLIGVTGTNGKTTTVTLTQHLLASAGHKCGLIGTVQLDTGSPQGPRPAQLTTPGAIELSQLLTEMVANGCVACVMEVSSHALHQGRADHVKFAAAAFTNLTQDHLDYHGTMDAYADAKAILFEGLDDDAVAVINADDPASKRMVANCKARVVRTMVFAQHPATGNLHIPAEYAVLPQDLATAGSRFALASAKGVIQTSVPMPGRHNLSNAVLAAALASEAADLTQDQLQQGLETCRPVPGRLEPVGPNWPSPPTPNSQLPTTLVDYAHTPDALINVGSAMHALTQGKLITVFGCGGDRDRAKRPLMAKAAQQYAHIVVLTSDNPRTEDPQQILDDAAEGFFPAAIKERHIIPDRAQAIRFAIDLADANDTVLIAGKGHEDYQIIGTTKHPFDDRQHAAAALRDKRNNTLH